MIIDTGHLERCIRALDRAHSSLAEAAPESLEYEIYRSASIKEFEIILEQSGKLLRKALKPYFHSSMAADRLVFKDIFRNAVLRGIIDDATCERWLKYRDARNSTAHDYGEFFAEETLTILPQFIVDAYSMVAAIQNTNNAAEG